MPRPRPAPELQPRLRFPHAGPDAFGPGKAELLRLVVVRRRDGHSALLALAEFDPACSARTGLLAPGETKGARWARRVSSVEIASLPAAP